MVTPLLANQDFMPIAKIAKIKQYKLGALISNEEHNGCFQTLGSLLLLFQKDIYDHSPLYQQKHKYF